MKRFKFRFEAVEKVRKTREKESLRALGAAQRELLAARARKDSLVSALQGSLLRRERLGQEAVSPTAYVLETDFIQGTKARIIQSEQGITRAQRGVEKAMRVYLLALRQLRAIENLREKMFAEFKRAKAKKEQKESDDLTLMRQAFRPVFAVNDDTADADAPSEDASA
jgi:flagellar export protein FliJ